MSGTVRDMSETVDLLQQLIQNACVNDGTPESGQEIRSVETLHDYFGKAGTTFEKLPGRTSTVYRIPGTKPSAPTLMMMAHLDVVPVNEDGTMQLLGDPDARCALVRHLRS